MAEIPCPTEVVSRLFYAQRDMWTPFVTAVGGLMLNAGVGWLFLPVLAHGGLALSNGLGALLQVVCLLLVARWRLGGLEGRALGVSLLRTAVASALMGAAVVGFCALLLNVGRIIIGVGGLAALILGSAEVRGLGDAA